MLLLLAAGVVVDLVDGDGRMGEIRPRNFVPKEKKRTDLVAWVRKVAGVKGLGREVGNDING